MTPDQQSGVPDVERIQAINVEPDDVIVVRLPAATTHEQADNLSKWVAKAFRRNKVMVLGPGVEIELYRKEHT